MINKNNGNFSMNKTLQDYAGLISVNILVSKNK